MRHPEERQMSSTSRLRRQAETLKREYGEVAVACVLVLCAIAIHYGIAATSVGKEPTSSQQVEIQAAPTMEPADTPMASAKVRNVAIEAQRASGGQLVFEANQDRTVIPNRPRPMPATRDHVIE